jgi:hypothetical protein
MSPIIRGPQLTKKSNQYGAMESCFTFNITKSNEDSYLTVSIDDAQSFNDLSTILHGVWWNEWLSHFLQATSKHFSKPYTVQQIHKITKHTLHGTVPDTFPVSIQLYPIDIEIRGTSFMVHWGYIATPMMIDIPDLYEDDVPLDSGSIEPTGSIHPPSACDIEEVNIDQLPINQMTLTESLSVHDSGRFHDKHKLKEARLKAKIAMYKVQHQMARYYEKYGTEASDSEEEWSEDSDCSEEVQL